MGEESRVMQLTVRDVARILKVGESLVYRWVNEQSLPAERVNGQYRFNRAELLEWAAARKMEVDPALFQDANGHSLEVRLDEAIAAGGVVHALPGSDKESVLRAVIAALPVPDECDRDFLLQIFQNREALGSTEIGDGLAIPHPRYPIVLPVECPSITVCFLEHPIQYTAHSKQPVHTLFALVSPTARVHLQLLARLSLAVRDAQFRELIQRKGQAEEILERARELEDSLRRSRPAADTEETR